MKVKIKSFLKESISFKEIIPGLTFKFSKRGGWTDSFTTVIEKNKSDK